MNKPLTQENQKWFIENGNADHEGQLYANELGNRLEGEKACFVKVEDVRSALECLKEQILIRRYHFEEAGDSIITESHIREIDSISELIDMAFPIFVDKGGASDE